MPSCNAEVHKIIRVVRMATCSAAIQASPGIRVQPAPVHQPVSAHLDVGAQVAQVAHSIRIQVWQWAGVDETANDDV